MVSLKELQHYCAGKEIIIVGNSSRILNNNYGKLIDNYDIVVRINKGYLHRQNLYSDKIGNKTHILSLGLKSAVFSANVIQRSLRRIKRLLHINIICIFNNRCRLSIPQIILIRIVHW